MGMNILLAGVGGQGVVLASKILARCAGARGEPARTAETIGMAQRGGSVTSHVRIGEGAYSPLIPRGAADVIIGFEPAEAVRALDYLKPGGAVTVSDRGVYPSVGAEEYVPEKMLDFLRSHPLPGDVRVLRADGVFEQTGSYRSLNLALLGAASEQLGVTTGEIEAAIRELLPERLAAVNIKALLLGARTVETA
ncbi:MAG: indolepyruvate oxidoreductase subunit beta [Oscillospiraceae bacterium]|nr:indolepyruvate oxidoreductase subunit beta [Oscillospiraceae bacterium]